MSTWTIGTDTGDVIADGLSGSIPTLRRGATATAEFVFYDPTSDIADQQAEYDSLLDYLDYAGNVATIESMDGTPHYRELQTDPKSLLLSFDPPAGLDITGFWGVLLGGSERTTKAGVDLALSLDVYVLAELDEYADRTAVETAHKL